MNDWGMQVGRMAETDFTAGGIGLSGLKFIVEGYNDKKKTVELRVIGDQIFDAFGSVTVPEDQVKLIYEDFKRPLYKDARNQEVTVNFDVVHVEKDISLIDWIHFVYSNGGYIAGSYAAWSSLPDEVELEKFTYSLNDLKPNDCDIFCKNDESYENILGHFLGVLAYTEHSENSVVVTLIPPEDDVARGLPTVQIVKPRYLANGQTLGYPEQIIDSFDFTVCRAVILPPVNGHWNVLIDEDLIKDSASRTLRFKNMHCPLGNMLRIAKYEKKNLRWKATKYQWWLLMDYTRSYPQEKFDILQNLTRQIDEAINAGRFDPDAFDEFALDQEDIDSLYELILVD